jgi:hypothetical protein
MPTILYIRGWRLFFYSNERQEPPHIHARKGEAECKYWLDADMYDISEAYSYNLSAGDRRAIRKIIFDHYEYILSEYEALHKGVES